LRSSPSCLKQLKTRRDGRGKLRWKMLEKNRGKKNEDSVFFVG